MNPCRSALRATAWKNLTFNSHYTWSHAFDLIDGELFSNIDNPFNTRWDYGPAGFDRRQISVTSIIYRIPVVQELRHPALRRRCWEDGSSPASQLFESGTPLSIGGGPDNLGFGGDTSNRANIVAPVTYPETRFQWFSTSSFAKPGPLQWGSAARNDVVGPGRNNWNISMFKAFQIQRARPVGVPGGNLQHLQPHAVH